MSTQGKNRTEQILKFLPQFTEAALSGKAQQIELLALSLIRQCKQTNPTIAQEMSEVLSSHAIGNPYTRSNQPTPRDSDAGGELLKVEDLQIADYPFFPETVSGKITQIIQEREKSTILLAEGIRPACTILLKGAPGTGKTMLAKWLAKELDLPLVILDLATVISSYLGKTGSNLKKVLDYGRNNPCVLLLDEFDAIAKSRSDKSEVGELVRIVNVLLKELEDWPSSSILIGATNHPEILDPAINRRFDINISIPLPSTLERAQILENHFGRFYVNISAPLKNTLPALLEGESGSFINTFVQSVLRQHLISEESIDKCIIKAISRDTNATLQNIEVIKALHDTREQHQGSFTVRDLSKIFNKSVSTVQYHLKKSK